ERLDRQRLLAVQRVYAALRHGERVVAEVDPLLVLVPLVEREVDDPAEREAVAVDEVQLLARPGTGRAGEGHELLRVAGDEEAGVAIGEAELFTNRFGTLLANVLGKGTSPFERSTLFNPISNNLKV